MQSMLTYGAVIGHGRVSAAAGGSQCLDVLDGTQGKGELGQAEALTLGAVMMMAGVECQVPGGSVFVTGAAYVTVCLDHHGSYLMLTCTLLETHKKCKSKNLPPSNSNPTKISSTWLSYFGC